MLAISNTLLCVMSKGQQITFIKLYWKLWAIPWIYRVAEIISWSCGAVLQFSSDVLGTIPELYVAFCTSIMDVQNGESVCSVVFWLTSYFGRGRVTLGSSNTSPTGVCKMHTCTCSHRIAWWYN